MSSYIPVNYLSYHKITYITAWGCVLIFAIFLSMMYLALQYETLNKQNKCNPMYYYGSACRNMISDKLLLNPSFSNAQRKFYQDLETYHPSTQQSTGAKPTIKESEKLINRIGKNAIETTLDENKEFVEKNADELNSMTSLLQLLSLKYLGNVQTTLEESKHLPKSVQTQIAQFPEELNNLRILVKNSLVDPVYAKYSAPLRKLYESLQSIPEPSSSS